MKEFKVFVKDKPGELARVTEALAEHAVNIRAIA
ncbi:MAG: ACT domain-containing protein, partial [Methanobacteriota archaeon]